MSATRPVILGRGSACGGQEMEFANGDTGYVSDTDRMLICASRYLSNICDAIFVFVLFSRS